MRTNYTYRVFDFDPDDVYTSPVCDGCEEFFEEGDEVFVTVDETPLVGGDRAAKCRPCHDWELWGVAR